MYWTGRATSERPPLRATKRKPPRSNVRLASVAGTRSLGSETSSVTATSTMTFTANEAIRVLPVDLMPKLRISDASLSTDGTTWTPAAVIQEPYKQDANAAVVFAKPLQAGQTYRLKLAYAGGDVLTDAGDGNFTVGARTAWYPNVGVFTDTATFTMRFDTPQKFQVVGVGAETENRIEGERGRRDHA